MTEQKEMYIVVWPNKPSQDCPLAHVHIFGTEKEATTAVGQSGLGSEGRVLLFKAILLEEFWVE